MDTMKKNQTLNESLGYSIKVENITKKFTLFSSPRERFKDLLISGWGAADKYTALDQVDFEIAPGEIVGIVGANGAGKSTLLQVVCGTLQPSSGSIKINGRISALLELGAGFNVEYTGIENIRFYCALQGLPSEKIEQILPEILAFADIGNYIHQPVKTYSSGMYVRVAFAAAIHIEPEILIVDEALSVGDVSFQAKCLERMETLMKQGTTVLLVTHDVQMVKQYCDRVLYLKQGRLVYDGAAEEGTEIYLNEAREKSVEDHKIEQNVIALNGAKFNFGTKLGAIESVELSSAGKKGKSIVVQRNARVELLVIAKIDQKIKNPKIQMTIRDRRGFNLFGFNERYANQNIKISETGVIKLKFSFDANLQLGDYAVTIRLDDSSSLHDIKLIDKQVGIADFTVTAPHKTFDAVLDLNGDCEVVL